jgi:NTE family protein
VTSGAQKTLALALGGGGARGLAHILVLETLDELRVKPAAIAGTSIGALIGAAYAAGLSGKQIRRYVLNLAHNRPETLRRLIAARAGSFARLFAGGIGNATLVDAEKFCKQFLPPEVPEDFSALRIPLTVVATDLYARRAAVFTGGALRRALAASMALPGLVRPVDVEGRILVDGGAIDPLPFEHLRGRADLTLAVDLSGEPNTVRRDVPSTWEALFATVLVMGNAIVTEKLKHGAPDLLIRPRVGLFRAVDFFQASAILRAAEPIKAELKERLAVLLAR